MNDRTSDAGPLAPRRSLGAPQAAAPSRGGVDEQTMAVPVVTDSPSTRAPRPRTAPADRPAAAERGASGPVTQQTPVVQAPLPQGAERPATPAPEPGEPTPAREDRKSRRPKIRKARLRLTRIDPWSVMKIAFALSVALAIVTVVAVAIVWSVLGAAGVWEAINTSVGTVLSDGNSSAFDVTEYVGMSRVVGLTAIVAAANVVLLTAIATLGAFLYNLSALMLGGLEVTLAEDR